MQYDVFISHASEDKESFVEPLATECVVLAKCQRIDMQYEERQNDY